VTKASPVHLGDSHNFGRRVSVTGARVHKPRTVVWEWLLLSAESPLRRLLRETAQQDGLGRDAFDFLPDLKFFAATAREGGDVGRVELKPLTRPSREGRRALARVVGRALALFSWLGVSDLHWENLVLGAGPRGRVIFAPLDIEIVLADLSLPTQTKLLPDADPEVAAICRHACGVRRVLPFLGKPVEGPDLLAVVGAYAATLAFLERHGSRIAEVFARLPGLRDTPIRVLLRGTDQYERARSEPVWPPLLEAETEQLVRGDVPYFFRLYGRSGIHYFAEPSLRRMKRIPSRGDVPRPDPVLSIARGLRSPNRATLREEGLLTVLGAFDSPGLSGKYVSEELEVTFKARTVTVRLGTGEELQTRRDMSAFVGSVYLPCRCGEVRSVFVPSVTTCVGRGGR
jgi:hypothetical protein